MMVIILIIVQLALWAHAAQVVQLAASEGDRAARVAGGNADAGRSGAKSVLVSAGSVVTSSSTSVVLLSGEQIEVTVEGTAESVVPWLRLPVSSTEIGIRQQFRTSG